MKNTTLLLLLVAAACGTSSGTDAGAGGGGGGATGGGGGGSAPVCAGTHAPCSTYVGTSQALQQCQNHGCSVNGSNCVGTPHACDAVLSGNCGDGHGCDACARCGAGTRCVQDCLNTFYSPKVRCVTTAEVCTTCDDTCAAALCGAGYDAGTCATSCAGSAPNAYQCNR